MEFELDKIKYLGVALGALGLLALLVLTPEYRALKPSDAAEKMVGQKVSFSGIVKEMFVRNGHAFFALENSGTVKAVLFNAGTAEISALRENRSVQVSGTLSLYKNGFEIIVDRVKRLN